LTTRPPGSFVGDRRAELFAKLPCRRVAPAEVAENLDRDQRIALRYRAQVAPQARKITAYQQFCRACAALTCVVNLNSIRWLDQIFAQLLRSDTTTRSFANSQHDGRQRSEPGGRVGHNLTFFAHPLLLVCEDLVRATLWTPAARTSRRFGRKQVAHIIGVGEKAPEQSKAPVVP